MAALAIPWQLGPRTLRLFGWVLAALLALVGHLCAPSLTALSLQLAGAAVFAIGTVRPGALRWFLAVLLVALWPAVWLGLWLLRSFAGRDLIADLAASAQQRLRPRRRVPQA
jgi:hypothetical protein